MWKFTGKGFVMGIPARDLTDDEVQRYGLKEILSYGLWKKEKPQPSENKVQKPKGETKDEKE